MRILFISAFYPPQVVGGWEQLVQDINHRLQQRGHTTHVLTGTYGVTQPISEPGVDRLLTLESDLYHYNPRNFWGFAARLKQNLAYTRQVIDQFKPDVVYIHVMWNLSPGIAWQAEQHCPNRVVYYVANDWPHAPDAHTAYWTDPAITPVANLLKKLIAPIPLALIKAQNQKFLLQFKQVECVSQAVQKELAAKAGIAPAAMRVVYNGVETDQFTPSAHWPPERIPGQNLKLLYAGSLVSHKGVHTAIEALAELNRLTGRTDTTLGLVGSGHPNYESRLRQLIDHLGLADQVSFLGRVSREKMPSLLKQFEVLIFPSIWEEPLARMMQEAMAAGLVVVGTLTGGSGELLVEAETGLTFAPADAIGLARQLDRLQQQPGLFATLAQNGRNTVLARFDLNRMIDEIETHLQQVAGN